MPEYLSVVEASRRYLISEKTLRNWIKANILPADKVRLAGRLQYAINPAMLEATMNDRNMTAIPVHSGITDSTTHIKALEQRLEALERRVSELEASLRTPKPEIPTLPLQPISKPLRTHHANPDKANNPIPAGCVSFVHFLHGIPESSARRWKQEQSSDVAQDGIWHGDSGHQVKIILTPEGQYVYCQWAKDRKGFSPCADCPHKKPLLASQT